MKVVRQVHTAKIAGPFMIGERTKPLFLEVMVPRAFIGRSLKRFGHTSLLQALEVETGTKGCVLLYERELPLVMNHGVSYGLGSYVDQNGVDVTRNAVRWCYENMSLLAQYGVDWDGVDAPTAVHYLYDSDLLCMYLLSMGLGFALDLRNGPLAKK